MKKIKIILISLVSIMLVFSAIYSVVSIYLCSAIYGVMQENYNSYGKEISEKYKNFITQEIYDEITYREERDDVVREKNDIKFLASVWWGDSATVYYSYDYCGYDKDGEAICGLGSLMPRPKNLIIKLSFEDGSWKVKNVDWYIDNCPGPNINS